jgi:protein TonB
MTAMTFESIHGAPRRAAARRVYRTASRAASVSARPVSITAPRAVADAKQLRNRIAFIAAVGVVVALHVAIIALVNRPMEVAPISPKVPLLTLDIAPPPPPPPPVIQPKPLPQVAAAKPVARQPAPSVPVVQSIADTTAPSADTVQVAIAAPPLPIAPPPAPEPVTEPRGYAGYLNNPEPSYPPAAQKHGLQGKVVLKIHVSASGHPDNVSIAKSSGYDILDAAAVKAVTTWVFEPAKRGQKPIDGWVNVPIDFKLS